MSWGVAVAGVGQCLLLILAMRNAGMVLRPVLPRLTPAVRRLLSLMAPGTMGAGVMHRNMLIGTMIASLLPTGAVRSEERSGGRECGRTCTHRSSASQSNKKEMKK